MKINISNLLLALGLSGLIAYGFWSLGGDLINYVSIGSFLFLAGTLFPAVGIDFELARPSTNLRIVCIVFFCIGFTINLACVLINPAPTFYILLSAISFLVFIFISKSIYAITE